MAQSIVKHPGEIVRELERDFQISDEEEILAFLERYPTAAPLLFDIRTNIRRFFGVGCEPPSHLACLTGTGTWHSPTS
jgi:hypothetical protein